MKHSQTTNELNYQDLFIMGICAIGAGSVFATISILTFIGMMGIGLCLMTIGLVNRKKWET